MDINIVLVGAAIPNGGSHKDNPRAQVPNTLDVYKTKRIAKEHGWNLKVHIIDPEVDSKEMKNVREELKNTEVVFFHNCLYSEFDTDTLEGKILLMTYYGDVETCIRDKVEDRLIFSGSGGCLAKALNLETVFKIFSGKRSVLDMEDWRGEEKSYFQDEYYLEVCRVFTLYNECLERGNFGEAYDLTLLNTGPLVYFTMQYAAESNSPQHKIFYSYPKNIDTFREKFYSYAVNLIGLHSSGNRKYEELDKEVKDSIRVEEGREGEKEFSSLYPLFHVPQDTYPYHLPQPVSLSTNDDDGELKGDGDDEPKDDDEDGKDDDDEVLFPTLEPNDGQLHEAFNTADSKDDSKGKTH